MGFLGCRGPIGMRDVNASPGTRSAGLLPLLFSKLGARCLTRGSSIHFPVESACVTEQMPSGFDPFIPEFLPNPKHCDLFD